MEKPKLYLSCSSIQTFITCKRKFQYKYIEKIKMDQGNSNKYISFGQSIHSALKEFNLIANEEDKTLEKLLKLFRKNWIRKGYSSIEEEIEFGKKGIAMLTSYFNDPKDESKKILMVEEMIYKDIDGEFILCGKLDKVYVHKDNSTETIDYKTGSTISVIDNLQLPIYLLLTHEKLGHYPDIVSFYFLQPNRKVSREVDMDYIEEAIELVKEAGLTICCETEYPCTITPNCKDGCEYFLICNEAIEESNKWENGFEAFSQLDNFFYKSNNQYPFPT